MSRYDLALGRKPVRAPRPAPEPEVIPDYCMGVDFGRQGSWISIAHVVDGGVVHIDSIEAVTYMTMLLPRVVELCTHWPMKAVVLDEYIDRGLGEDILHHLGQAGVHVVMQDHDRALQLQRENLFNALVREERLTLPEGVRGADSRYLGARESCIMSVWQATEGQRVQPAPIAPFREWLIYDMFNENMRRQLAVPNNRYTGA